MLRSISENMYGATVEGFTLEGPADMIQSLLSGRSGRTQVRVSVVRDWPAQRLRRVGGAGTLKSSRRPIQ
jgi:hypothetical protein